MKSFLTIDQLKNRIQQLNNLIGKFPTVRSLVRKWGFELVQLEGKLETLKSQQYVEKEEVMLVDEFIEKINCVQGFEAARWQKHGLDRVYLNKINGKSEASFLNVASDGSLAMGKYFCPLSIEELFKIAANANPALKEDNAPLESRIVYTSKWERIGSGRVRTVRWTNGKETWETIETNGDVSQSDLDDYFG